MKKLFLIFILGIMGVFISSCDSTDDPIAPEGTGNIFITSTPAGAQIWVQGANTGKLTPDTVFSVAIGSRDVMLKLANYIDTTFSVTVVENQLVSRNITLTSNLMMTKYSSVKIWETAGTGANKPSGLDLSLGMAFSIADPNTRGQVDVYYSSNGYLIQSANLGSGMSRVTRFNVGNANNLDDGMDSPLNTSGGWTDNVNDTQANYFYLYDNDGHYSKARITARGTDPDAWVEITWWYNSTPGDERF